MSALIDHVIGIDLSKARIDVAKKISKDLQNVEFVQGSISQLPFSDNYFDFVFSFSVIYYTDVELTIQELTRVLKPVENILFKWLMVLL